MRCYRCYRPINRCFCDTIPKIENRTNVLILQHQRERYHPFNTGRIVHLALSNSTLVAEHTKELERIVSGWNLADSVGLLYPGADSRVLDEVPINDRPTQLVILDGTWHHTKTLVRDIPKLRDLPRYRLAPAEPSRYTIRREPHAQYISTVEATVAALRCLEPETQGLDDLLNAFLGMISDQLSLPMPDYGGRRTHRKKAKPFNTPAALIEQPEDIVVIYGETAPGTKGDGNSNLQRPVYWVAERLLSGERFECAIVPPMPLSSTFLEHLDLPRSAFDHALTMDEFKDAWCRFLRPTDILTFYYSNIVKLIERIGLPAIRTIQLKCIKLESMKSKSLEKVLESLSVTAPRPSCQGRAGRRLANSLALARMLNANSQPRSTC